MAISIYGVTTCAGSTGGGSSTITFSSTTPIRGSDVGYVWGGMFNTANYVTVVFSTTVVAGAALGLFRKVFSVATDRVLSSASFTTCANAYGTMVLRGVASTSPEDITTIVTSGSNTAPTSGAIITQKPNTWVLSLVGVASTETISAVPSGYTNTANASATAASTLRGFTVMGASKLVAATGTETPGAWTIAVSAPWVALTVAVRAYVPPTSTELMIYVPGLQWGPTLAQ